MDCCGSPHHEITVQAGGRCVTLMRCGQCAEQIWTVDGTAVERKAAFAQLSQAYAGVSQPSKATRARIAADREARLVERRAHASSVRSDGPERRAPLDGNDASGDVASQLSTMLQGWQVLGSSA